MAHGYGNGVFCHCDGGYRIVKGHAAIQGIVDPDGCIFHVSSGMMVTGKGELVTVPDPKRMGSCIMGIFLHIQKELLGTVCLNKRELFEDDGLRVGEGCYRRCSKPYLTFSSRLGDDVFQNIGKGRWQNVRRNILVHPLGGHRKFQDVVITLLQHGSHTAEG